MVVFEQLSLILICSKFLDLLKIVIIFLHLNYPGLALPSFHNLQHENEPMENYYVVLIQLGQLNQGK